LKNASVRNLNDRWLCDVELNDRLSCIELGKWLGIEDIVKVVQRKRSRWYGHVSRKDDNESVLIWRLR